MDLIDVTEKIRVKITQLNEMRTKIDTYGKAKAVATTEYDKAMAQTIVALKNGKPFTVGTETIVEPPMSIIDRVAKGICWAQALEKDKADIAYKNLLETIDIIKIQLNALQSINRNLSTM